MELRYVVLNPIHTTFKNCPMIIDEKKCNNNFTIHIHKHLSILTAKKFYRKINIYNRDEYPE
jgi:hypothetical protein